MNKLILLIIIILLASCNENYRKYTGYFKNIDKKAFGRDMLIRHIHSNEYEISILDGEMIFKGRLDNNRITAMFYNEDMIAAYGKMPDSTKSFYDFSFDCNRITVSSEDMNSVETFIRIK